jgi:hypothetical protein
MLQTKVTPKNQLKFYQNVYYMQADPKDRLINLDKFDTDCVVIDCCGSHYRTQFDKNITVLETIRSAKEFNFSKNQFDKLIDNRDEQPMVWPTLSVTAPVLIFDRSPMLKYLSPEDLCSTVSVAAEKYQAALIVIRQHLFFVDDSRLVDRFYNFCNFKIKNYCVTQFLYDTQQLVYSFEFKRIQQIE